MPLNFVDPLALASVIYIISGLSLVPFAKASFGLKSRRELHYIVAVTGIGGVTAPLLLLHGLQQTTASDASILTNGEMLFTIILSSLFFGEKPKDRLAAAAIGIVIIGLFMATTNMQISDTILRFNVGNILILAAMLMWAIDNNITRRLTTFSDIKPAKIGMLKSLFGGVVMLGITAVTGRWDEISGLDYDTWLLVTGIAIAGFAATTMFFIRGIKHMGTIKTMSLFSTTPIFGIAIAALVLGETISAFQVMATVMMLGGVLLLIRH